MKSESDEITDDEFLLRRVRFDRFRTDKLPIISPSSFEPRLEAQKVRDPDTEGISLYRESCLQSPHDCLAKVEESRRADWGVVRIPVHELKRNGLSVTPSKDDIPGHVVIPEISASAFKSDRAAVQSKMDCLARIASQKEHIAVTPLRLQIAIESPQT